MIALLAAFAGLLGLAIGSFLNVVVWRLPQGLSLSHPPSACPGCEHPIRWHDNIPALGWLLLRGRCRDCTEPIAVRYPLVEAATAGLFVGLALLLGVDWELPAFLYLAAVGIALALIDLDVQRLPDALTLPSYPVFGGLLVLAAVLDSHDGDLLRAGIGALALGGFYFAVWFAYPSGMGFGDVKLAPLLGAALGWFSYGVLAVGAFLGFAYGAALGIALIARGGGRKTRVPFGPFMLLGALSGIVFGQHIADAYTRFTLG